MRARASLPLVASLLLTLASSALAAPDSAGTALGCDSPEACFLTAITSSDGAIAIPDRLRIKIDRLQKLQERHPGSVWARRAGLLIGVLLSDQDPGEALRFLKAAQRDVPLLEDYIRFWTGEALLKMGDAAQAAVMLESVPETVPDTPLQTRASFRSGEAWARAGWCRKAIDALARAVSIGPQDVSAPAGLLTLAQCHAGESRTADAAAALRQLWVRYPNSPEAREAEIRLTAGKNGTAWHPSPDDVYERALSFSTLALHADAVAEYQKFLAMAPQDGRRDDARFKLALSFVRLKRYEQARDIFQSLAGGQSKEAAEAIVWLTRIYLRQGEGDRLLALPHPFTKGTLSAQQRSSILLLTGIWLEDQGQYDEALAKYRQAGNIGSESVQRAEALWKIGWVQYRMARYDRAAEAFRHVLGGKEEGQGAPQALYWLARSQERLKDPQALETYLRLCRQYVFTYYCQVARAEGKLSIPVPVSTGIVPIAGGFEALEGKPNLGRDRRFLRAFELKIIGMDQDAAKELAMLTERYARDRPVLMDLSTLLNEVGAHYQAVRLARLHFRNSLEQGGDAVPAGVWAAAYPTAYLPKIQVYAGTQVDPFLAAAIIREESQYDARALSRVGAVGLMQMMPATAQAVSRKHGAHEVRREDLFDPDTNIQFGVRYLAQLLQQYSGNVIHAVAAYNAGPQAVSAWIQKYGGKDADEFVELIPYQETRQYVKRVLRSYREYVRLAGGICGARSLDKAC